MENNQGCIDDRNSLNVLNGKEWIKRTISFKPQKGLGAKHPHAMIERQHPAPFSYQDVQYYVEFFTKPDMRVLDPFSGVGSTLKACALSGRIGYGIEIVEKWHKLALERLEIEIPDSIDTSIQKLILGDCRIILQQYPDDFFHYTITSPPYWSILNKKPDHKIKQERISNGLDTNYSDNPHDLANIETYDQFLEELKEVFKLVLRKTMTGKYCSIIVGDFRDNSHYFAYHIDIYKLLEEIGWKPKGISILTQPQKRIFPYGYPYQYVPNIHHQYILIFQKE